MSDDNGDNGIGHNRIGDNRIGDDGMDGGAVAEEPTPLQRALELLVFAPVGVVLTVADDLPGLIGKGRQRFETDVQNARVVGRFFVTHGQRQLLARVGKLLHGQASDGPGGDTGHGAQAASVPAVASPSPSPRPHADPADVMIVEGALAGYDTLSASQVVRRLESLGPDELRALHRHEASHRNRRTILNRAHQILEAVESGGGAVQPSPAAPREGPTLDGPTPDGPTPDRAAAAPSPPTTDAAKPYRSGE